MRVMLEEIDHVPAAAVILRMRQNRGADARSREWRREGIADGRLRAIRHQDQPVREIERLVDPNVPDANIAALAAEPLLREFSPASV